MISTLQSSPSIKEASYHDLVLKLTKDDLSTRYLIHSPGLSMRTARNSLTDTTNIVHHLPTTASIEGEFVDDLASLLPRSRPIALFGRVATEGCHDMDAWTQGQKVHDTKHNAVAASSSLVPNGTVPNGFSPVDVAKGSFALMESRARGLRSVGQLLNDARPREATANCPHEWSSLVTPCSSFQPVRDNVSAPSSREDLSEARRRVGEILVRCGVIDISGRSPIESTVIGCITNAPAMSTVTVELSFRENNEHLITALASWTSEWVHTLVLQPYLRGGFRFQYQGKPNKAPSSVALRIRRTLSDVYNPVQVAIHALWFIGLLAGNGTHDNAPPTFLSVPFFRYLHNNGTFIAEDFMFRTFIACAMIGDKAVNDTTLSTNTWNRLTRIPQVILNATEKYALSCLKWNVVMTRIQWQDTIIYLRSCIKMGSAFDPFAYDEASPSGVMARYLDELINLSHVDTANTSQRGQLAAETLAPRSTQHCTHWEFFDSPEWCPKDDPVVNQKPQTIGIAPGAADQDTTRPLKFGMTAKDLFDSILGPSNITNFAHLARPAGTSFCGSFGAIGTRLAHTVKVAGACQNASWFPSHG